MHLASFLAHKNSNGTIFLLLYATLWILTTWDDRAYKAITQIFNTINNKPLHMTEITQESVIQAYAQAYEDFINQVDDAAFQLMSLARARKTGLKQFKEQIAKADSTPVVI